MPDPNFPDDILNKSVRDFIAATAAKNPTPGGGSVAALAGALAAALVEMALHYTVDKKQFAHARPEIANAIEKLRKAGALMQDLVYEDIAAYQKLSPLLKLSDEQRLAHPDYLPAVVAAIRAPESVGGLALHILELCAALVDKCNPNLLSDLGAGAALAHATVRLAYLNVLVNLRLLPNIEERQEARARLEAMTTRSDILWHTMREHLSARL